VSHINVASSDVTQVSSICMASWAASLSRSGGCWSPSWELHSSTRHKRTSVRASAREGVQVKTSLLLERLPLAWPQTVPTKGWLQVLLLNLQSQLH